jgi:hypothetical protein
MASPPKFTENAAAPLTAEELAGDRATSGQTTDPLDKPHDADTGRLASEATGEDGSADVEEREAQVLAKAITMLPPG